MQAQCVPESGAAETLAAQATGKPVAGAPETRSETEKGEEDAVAAIVGVKLGQRSPDPESDEKTNAEFATHENEEKETVHWRARSPQ